MATKDLLAPVPGLPAAQDMLNVPPEILKNCWTIFYRHGINALLSKTFYFEGTMKEAIERAQKHCGIMGYKYHFLRPLVCDIEYEENVQLGKIDPRTGKLKDTNNNDTL